MTELSLIESETESKTNFRDYFTELIDDNEKKIGNYYIIYKKYFTHPDTILFKGKLTNIVKEVEVNGKFLDYYYFDDFQFYYKNNQPVKLPAPYHVIPKNTPWPVYLPKTQSTYGLISIQFLERKTMNLDLKQQLLSLQPFYMIMDEMNRKTSIPYDLLKYVIKSYLW
jgi:hypothetical protein